MAPIFAETFVDLIKDGNHWLFEGVAAVVEFVIVGIIITPLAKRWVRNHDLKEHDHECE